MYEKNEHKMLMKLTAGCQVSFKRCSKIVSIEIRLNAALSCIHSPHIKLHLFTIIWLELLGPMSHLQWFAHSVFKGETTLLVYSLYIRNCHLITKGPQAI